MTRLAAVRPWLPALLYMGVIWAISSLDVPELPLRGIPMRDKLVHSLEYAVLGVFVAHASARTWPRHHVLRLFAFSALATFAWGVLDEIHQAFVPSRSADILDLAADTLGALLGPVPRLLRHARRAGPTARNLEPANDPSLTREPMRE